MAIDKNFVIKNGLEVNTNVLVAAADEKQVGIGTTRPYYKLHVGGGEGSRGGIGATDITISGIATLGVGNSSQGALNVVGISTFDGDVDLLGSAGVSTVRWDASENRLEFKDNASVGFGTGNDLTLWHDSSTSYIKDTVGDLRIAGDKITLELEDGTDVKVIDQFGVNITGVTTTNRLLVSGVSTLTSVGSNLIPDTDGNRNIGAATSEWGDVFVDGTAHIDTLDVDETAYVTTSLTVGTGVTIQSHGGVSIAGITTVGGALDVNSTSDFANNVNISAGSLNISAGGITLGSGATITNAGNAAFAGIVTANGGVNVGTAVTIDAETGNVAVSGIMTVGGNLNVTGDIVYDEVTGRNINITGVGTFADNAPLYFGDSQDLMIKHVAGGNSYIKDTTNDVVIQTGQLRVVNAADNQNLAEFNQSGTARLYYAGTERLSTTAIGATVFGDLVVAGVTTAEALKVSGVSTFTGAIDVNSTSDFGGTITLSSGQFNVGTAATISANGNATFSGIVTASQFQGGGIGVGIGSTTAHVGYGFTYLDLKGPGVSTVYASATTGITTIYFQGGGSSVGAAGTWQNDGTQGISTAKSVGINTVGVAVTALMGGEKGASSGIGASMQGLYIGNGMMINDNQLNGNHYIGTAFGGIMAGPVTVNGVVTVDGNWAVV